MEKARRWVGGELGEVRENTMGWRSKKDRKGCR